MNTLACDGLSNTVFLSTAEAPELQVSQHGVPISRYLLPEGKSTIGSSPSCQIRLSCPAVRPLQCLIVRDGADVTITRWATGIQLNGLEFTTAPLAPGDLLTVGELKLELLGTNSPEGGLEFTESSPVELIDELAAQVEAEATIHEAPATTAETQEDRAPLEIARLHAANQQTRQRFRRLVTSLRELRQEAHGLDLNVTTLREQLNTASQDQDRLTAELHQSQALAAERESQIGEELDRAIAELTASYAKAEAATGELDSLRERNGQFQLQIDSISEELARLTETCTGQVVEKQRLEELLNERESQLVQLRDELSQLRVGFETSIAELRCQNDALQNHLSDVERDRDLEVAELQQGLEASIVELHEQNENLRDQLSDVTSDRERQLTELRGLNDSLRNDMATVAAERDRHIAELTGLHDSLRDELSGAIVERERQIADLQAVNDSLRSEAVSVNAERDSQLTELRELNNSLRHEVEAISADRDCQITELSSRYDAMRGELSAVIAERERELQTLRDQMDSSVHDLCKEAEHLTMQLSERAAERDHAIRELEQAHLAALAESGQKIEALHQQLATAAAEQEERVSALQVELENARRVAEEAERLSKLPDPEKVELESELQVVRSERQKLAEEKHHLSVQLEDEEQRAKLLEIDVRSVNAEWQRAQNTISRLQDELFTAQAHTADLDAKLADFQSSAAVERAADSDAYAGDISAIRQELLSREQELAESHVESEKLRSQLESTEEELSACRSNIADIQEQLVELQAKTIESGEERARLAAEIEARDAQISRSDESFCETIQKFTADLADRDTCITELKSQLGDLQSELAVAASAEEARVTEITQQVTSLQAAAEQTAIERESLISSIAENKSQIDELLAAAQQAEQKHFAELEDRDRSIGSLTAELADTQARLSKATSSGEEKTAGLNAALAQLEHQLVIEVRAREVFAAERSTELEKLRETLTAEIATRDEEIVELTDQVSSLRNAPQLRDDLQNEDLAELQHKLTLAEEKVAGELARREEKIAELARELHETQDQLAECAAQGERLSELYQQAQVDLAAMTKAQDSVTAMSVVAEPKVNESVGSSAEVQLLAKSTLDDPRDNDSPRLERALANLVVEPEIDELNTKTTPFQPESFIDRYSHIFDETNDCEAPTLPGASFVTESTTDLHDVAGDDTAALEAYMANMMKRVRGESSSDAIVPPISHEVAAERQAFSNPVARMDTLTHRVGTTVDAELLEPDTESLIDLQELRQSSQKPPLPTSLSAMRELANSSARQAIAKHRKRRHFEGALSKLLVTGIAGSTAAYMLLTADSFLSTYFLAGCGVAVVSGYWGLKLCGILLEIIRDGINRGSTLVELEDSTDPLPIDGVSS